MGAGLLVFLTPVEMLIRSAVWGTIYVASSDRRREAATRLHAYWKALVNDFDEARPPREPMVI